MTLKLNILGKNTELKWHQISHFYVVVLLAFREDVEDVDASL